MTKMYSGRMALCLPPVTRVKRFSELSLILSRVSPVNRRQPWMSKWNNLCLKGMRVS